MSALRLAENESPLDLGEPERISEEHLSMLKAAQHRLVVGRQEAREHVLRLEGGVEAVYLVIAEREQYGIKEGDRINEDGTIVRAFPK